MQADPTMRGCPHLLEVARDSDSAELQLVFCLPEPKLGWALALAREPGLIGAIAGKASVLTGDPDRSSELRLNPAAAPPCGSDCTRCPHHLVRCGGCPVTPLYREGYRFE